LGFAGELLELEGGGGVDVVAGGVGGLAVELEEDEDKA